MSKVVRRICSLSLVVIMLVSSIGVASAWSYRGGTVYAGKAAYNVWVSFEHNSKNHWAAVRLDNTWYCTGSMPPGVIAYQSRYGWGTKGWTYGL